MLITVLVMDCVEGIDNGGSIDGAIIGAAAGGFKSVPANGAGCPSCTSVTFGISCANTCAGNMNANVRISINACFTLFLPLAGYIQYQILDLTKKPVIFRCYGVFLRFP